MKKIIATCIAVMMSAMIYADEEASSPESADQLKALTAELKALKADISATKKELAAKKSEAGKITRTIKGAYLLGDMSQMGLIARRRPTKEEKRFYPSGDLFLVKPVCVCKHCSAEDGGTTLEHFEFSVGLRGKTKRKPCPQYLAWRKAMDDVDKTNAMKTRIEPVLAEEDAIAEKLNGLEEKKKDLEQQIKEEKKRRAAEKSAAAEA